MAIRNKQLGRCAAGCCMLVAVLLCEIFPAIAFSFESAQHDTKTDYHLDALAFGLKDAPASVRADLAYIAVSELAAAYAQESALARAETRHRPGQRKLRRWAVAVENLAAELEVLAETITAHASVQTGFGPGNSLYLVVDGTPVVVNGPRNDDQDALEARIVSRFCRLHPCAQLLPPPSSLDPDVTLSTPGTVTHWSFSAQAGPVCRSEDGLVFQFDTASDLKRKRTACARVVAELRLIVDAIRLRLERGTRVDWQELEIFTLPVDARHEIRLNSDGDSLTLYIPALAAAPGLFDLLRPWLAANVKGVKHEVTVNNAETLLPPVGFLGQ